MASWASVMFGVAMVCAQNDMSRCSLSQSDSGLEPLPVTVREGDERDGCCADLGGVEWEVGGLLGVGLDDVQIVYGSLAGRFVRQKRWFTVISGSGAQGVDGFEAGGAQGGIETGDESDGGAEERGDEGHDRVDDCGP